MVRDRNKYKVGMFVKPESNFHWGKLTLYKITSIIEKLGCNDSNFLIQVETLEPSFDPDYFEDPIEGKEEVIKLLYE